MKYPDIIYMSPVWVQRLTNTMAVIQEAKWVPARPLGYPSFSHRVKAAWLVFTGEADALVWPQDRYEN